MKNLFTFHYIVLACFFCVLSGTGCTSATSPVSSLPATINNQPNIIIIMADDLGYGDLSSYGNAVIKTPHLDSLADEGQRWTDFYATAPVCSTTRGAFMTGRLPPRTGLYGKSLAVMFPNDPGGIPQNEITLAEALRALGYNTAMFGKWHLGDAPDSLPTRHGFDEWVGIPYSNDMDWAVGMNFEELVLASMQGKQAEVTRTITERMKYYFDPKIHYWNIPLVSSKRTSTGLKDSVLERPADQRELTKRYTQMSVGFIHSMAKKSSAPFFLYLAHSMPHTPLFRSDAFVDKSQAGRYGDVIEEIDWSIGEIRTALEDSGIADNTLLVFTSDNGPWLFMQAHGGSAGPLRHGKGTTFEGGMRVPGIFWWPGQIKPDTVTEIGSITDLYHTAIALAEGKMGKTGLLDGVDLSPVLLKGNDVKGNSSTSGPRQSMPYYRQGSLMAYREGRYKIHFITEGAYGMPPVRTEHQTPLLFDLQEDPGETVDLAKQKPDILQQLIAGAQRHRDNMVIAAPLFDQRLQNPGNKR